MSGRLKLYRHCADFILSKCTQKVPYVYFEIFEIFALNKLSNECQIHKNWTATFENIRRRWCLFPIIFFIFNKRFCPISQNYPGRHKVPFVVMCHIQCSFQIPEAVTIAKAHDCFGYLKTVMVALDTRATKLNSKKRTLIGCSVSKPWCDWVLFMNDIGSVGSVSYQSKPARTTIHYAN